MKYSGKIIVQVKSLHTDAKTEEEAEAIYMENPEMDDAGDYQELLYLTDEKYSMLLDFIENLRKW